MLTISVAAQETTKLTPTFLLPVAAEIERGRRIGGPPPYSRLRLAKPAAPSGSPTLAATL